MVIVNTVVYVRTELNLSESGVAVAYAAFGGGSMIVALALPRLLGRLAERTVAAFGGGMIAAALAGASVLPDFPPMLALWFVLGAGSSLIQTPAGRLLRRSCHEEDRPAVYSAHFALSHLCWLIAYPLAGHAGSMLGLSGTFIIVAGLAAAAASAGFVFWPAEDRILLEHEHEELVHTHSHTHDEHHQHPHEGEEPAASHRHRHRHRPLRHAHPFVIDHHHQRWP